MSLIKRSLSSSRKFSAYGGFVGSRRSVARQKRAYRSSSTSSTVSRGGKFSIAMTGFKELDEELKAIASEFGSKSVNTEMRKTTRDAMKTIVFPKVMAAAPFGTGFLRSRIKVRAIRRSRSKIGHRVGFNDPLFVGDTYYGGFLEFGFVHRSGTLVYGDSFLRRPLYDSESQIRSFAINRMRKWTRERNR